MHGVPHFSFRAAIEASGKRAEIVLRAVRDLLADCLSTLPALVERGTAPALHFHFATFDAPRREMFPQALEAYEAFARDGDAAPLSRAAHEGAARWLETARGLLALSPGARAAALEALLSPSAR